MYGAIQTNLPDQGPVVQRLTGKPVLEALVSNPITLQAGV